MITTANQFTTIPAFEYIAGCSIGNCTARETVTDMLKVLETCSSFDCLEYWRDIATSEDDQDLIELQDTIAQAITENCPLADYCTIELHECEWTVIPYIDDDLQRLDDIPDNHSDDFLYVVNDHGNVSLMHWHDQKREYVSVWSMV